MECDLSVHNPVSVRNTELFKRYTQADPRVAPLIFAVKYWARSRKLTEPFHHGGVVNSYTHVLMLLAFLMMERVIPPLQQICCKRPIKDHLEAFRRRGRGKYYMYTYTQYV
jgi:DNA polymerase sigma